MLREELEGLRNAKDTQLPTFGKRLVSEQKQDSIDTLQSALCEVDQLRMEMEMGLKSIREEVRDIIAHRMHAHCCCLEVKVDLKDDRTVVVAMQSLMGEQCTAVQDVTAAQNDLQQCVNEATSPW